MNEGQLVSLHVLSGGEARHGHASNSQKADMPRKSDKRYGVSYLVRCQHQGGEAGLLNDVRNDECFPLYTWYEHAWSTRGCSG